MTPPLDRVELRRMAEAITRDEIAHDMFIRRHYTLPIVTLLDDLEAAEARIEALREALDAALAQLELDDSITHPLFLGAKAQMRNALHVDAEAAK